MGFLNFITKIFVWIILITSFIAMAMCIIAIVIPMIIASIPFVIMLAIIMFSTYVLEKLDEKS